MMTGSILYNPRRGRSLEPGLEGDRRASRYNSTYRKQQAMKKTKAMVRRFGHPRTMVGAIAGSVLISGTVMLATASDVSAPEPAHLNGSLYGNGSAASATLTNSHTMTYGYRWPGSWAVGSAPGGTPCATYAAGAGTILYSVIQASGSYRKCT